LTAFQHTLAN